MIEINKSSMTSNQLLCMIIITVLGTEVLFYPNLFIARAAQDAWISTIFGSIYPIFNVLVADFMCKRFPDYNVLQLSKKFLGKFFGTILNVLFLFQFALNSVTRSANLGDLVRLYTNYFTTQKLAVTFIVIAVVYTAFKEISVLARSNQVIYYFTIIMVLVPLGVFTRGDPNNIFPVFKVNPLAVAAGSVRAGYDYFGIEIIFLLYPFLNNKGEFLKAGLKATAIFVGIYTWFTFASIFYFGIDIMPKYLWVVVETTKAFRMQTIKNFNFIFIIFWVLIVLSNISNNYFSVSLILNDLWGKFERRKYAFVLAPLLFYATLKIGDETEIRTLMATMVPIITIYNVLYVSIIALLIKMKEHKTYENT